MNKELISELSAQLFQAQAILDQISQTLSKELQSHKTALLFGLNYPQTDYSLNGCVNDVVLMSSTLQEKFKYGSGEVQLYTDHDLKGEVDVLDYLKKVIPHLSSGDKLFFHYSGHGLQVWDEDFDEADGLDEAIYTHQGIVTDDQIAEVLASIPSGVQVFLIFDCCNSGSICDLPYRYVNQSTNVLESSKEFAADIISLSGSRDDQTSADAWISERQNYYGALTSSVIGLIQKEDVSKLTWTEFADRVQAELKIKGYTQVPQICTNREELLKEYVQW